MCWNGPQEYFQNSSQPHELLRDGEIIAPDGTTMNPDDSTQFKLVDDDTTPSKGKCYAPFFLKGKLVVKRVFYVLKKSNLVDESSFKGAFLLPCYNMPTHKNIIFPFYVYLS